jgi:hypothetical protein
MNRRTWLAAITGAGVSTDATAQSPTMGRTPPQVLILTPRGAASASIGSGLVLTQQGTVYSLSAQQAAPVRHIPVMHKEGVFVVPGLVTLIRSGIVLTEGVDYERTADGARLTLQGWDVTDNWSALCR